MNLQDFKELCLQERLDHVRFVESGCGPMVIELHYRTEAGKEKILLRDEMGKVLSCRNLSEAYDVCREAGVHRAELVQVIPHDEACVGHYVSYDQQSMPLRF